MSSSQQEGRLDLSVMSPYVNHESARAENGDRGGVPSQDLGTPGQPIPKSNDLSNEDGIIFLVPSPSPRSRPPGAPVCLDPCSGPCADNGVQDSSRCSISINSLDCEEGEDSLQASARVPSDQLGGKRGKLGWMPGGD